MRIVNKIQARPLQFQAPPAKAYTLRALILSALARGESILRKPLLAEDQVNLIRCLQDLGIEIQEEPDLLRVQGLGAKFYPKKQEIFVGDSGVSMNFLCASAALAEAPVVIQGTPRLNERPIKEVVDGARQLGARIEYLDKEGFPPIRVFPGGLQAGRASINGSLTSQYFSALAIAAPCADGEVELCCLDSMTERPYFDITSSMMADFGVKLSNQAYERMIIPGAQEYQARDLLIEGDYSSASFLFLLSPVLETEVLVDGLNPLSVQGDKRFLDLLQRMGCHIEWKNTQVKVSPGDLQALDEDMSDVPDLVPPLAIAAAFARGKSRFRHIGHLVHKESNRIVAMETELLKMGIQAYHDEDSLYVEGNRVGIHGADIDTWKDHRIAMSFAVAGLFTGNQIIRNPSCVAKSFPDFWERVALF